MDPAATDGELDIRLAIKERKTVPFRTLASPAAIRSAFMIEADQTLTAAACPQMTQLGQSPDLSADTLDGQHLLSIGEQLHADGQRADRAGAGTLSTTESGDTCSF